jgi:hypothetical protein
VEATNHVLFVVYPSADRSIGESVEQLVVGLNPLKAQLTAGILEQILEKALFGIVWLHNIFQ